MKLNYINMKAVPLHIILFMLFFNDLYCQDISNKKLFMNNEYVDTVYKKLVLQKVEFNQYIVSESPLKTYKTKYFKNEFVFMDSLNNNLNLDVVDTPLDSNIFSKINQVTGFFASKYNAYKLSSLITRGLNGDIFEKNVQFINSVFTIPFIFSDVIFKDTCTFVNSEFKNSLLFSHTNFRNVASFSLIKANNLSLFKCNFNENVWFNNSDFYGNFETQFSNFKGRVVFNKVKFLNEVDFSNTIFHKELIFTNTTFYSVPNFKFVNLPGFLDFRNVSFGEGVISESRKKIDFRLCFIDSLKKMNHLDKCKIVLEGTDISKVLVPYNLFSLKFSSQATYEIKSGIYEAIINTCKENGMLDSVEGWDIEFQKFQNLHNHTYTGSIINFINDWWWGFGHEKWKILWIWLPTFFAIFVLYNWWRIEILYNKMYCDGDLGSTFLIRIGRPKNKEGMYVPDFSNNGFRFLYALFYTAAIYFGFKLKHEAVNYMYTRGFLYLYLMYIVGAIHVAYGLSYILNIY